MHSRRLLLVQCSLPDTDNEKDAVKDREKNKEGKDKAKDRRKDSNEDKEGHDAPLPASFSATFGREQTKVVVVKSASEVHALGSVITPR